MSKSGQFSVLLSVYEKSNANCLNEALKSIWDSQILKPAEIVLVQDGPITPEVAQIIEVWQHKLGNQFKWIKQKNNTGLASSLNHGMEYCSYDIVARMDDDDISLPDRFNLQYNYLLEHPEVGVLGSQIEERDFSLQKIISKRSVPINHLQIVKFAKYRSPINHPSVMYRKFLLCQYGGYPRIYPEDYALWGKLIVNGVIFHNLPDNLVTMRAGSSIAYRRGFRFFLGEVKVLNYLYKLGFINVLELFVQILVRFIVRTSPRGIKMILYRISRLEQ